MVCLRLTPEQQNGGRCYLQLRSFRKWDPPPCTDQPLRVRSIHPSNAPMPLQRHPNVDANVLGMLAPKLRRSSFIDTFRNLSNIGFISRQRCVNVVPTLYHDQNHNAASPLSLPSIVTTFHQCMNIVKILLPNVGDGHCHNIQVTLVNVVGKLLPNTWDWCCTTFRQCCDYCDCCGNVTPQCWGPVLR